MRRFDQLSKEEKKIALVRAEEQALKLFYEDRHKIYKSNFTAPFLHEVDLEILLEPFTQAIAQEAYYPDSEDIVINL